MVTQAPSRGAMLAAAVFLLASIALSLYVWTSLGGTLPLSPKGYRFHALFENASQLQPNAAVRMAGINVGRVVAVEPAGLRTDATIEMDTKFAPVPSDTRAVLRQKTLLGETFVALSPGSARARKIAEGGRLAVANVEATQPLDRVFGVLDTRTRHDIQALFSGGATALDGRGADLNAALGNLGPVSENLATMLAILDHQRTSVGGLVRDTGTVLQTVGDHRAALARLVGSSEAVMSATAERNGAVTATVRELGPLLATLRETSGRVTRTALLAGPTLHDLRPVAPLVEPALQAARTLAPQVEAVLHDLDGVLPVAERALPATAHLVGALSPFIDILYPATREITPVISLVTRYRRELVATMANAGAALQASAPGLDGKPVHYLRSLVPITEEAIVGYAKRLPSNRHNAYFAPGGLAQLAKGGLLASDCRNLANPQTVPVIGSGAPPCRLQPPWTIDGKTAYFPHLERTPAK
ncbi:MAG: phospholipid/cholesterol/gamma-HCH transport system substrate-binding protein [Solirubrobacteraceae bacterium]|nr:phospholipid/cholesterol/gamma-HCH transport system substrate-binding protein [Solirubrobacteraceae bacterium]